jgi:PPOX class probable F420-dependent enzyme
VSPQIAVNTAVSRDELTDFISSRHHAIVITARADGRPQASPVTCGVDAEGRIVIATYPERAKIRNARRNQQVSVVVLSDDFGGPWVQVDGTAEVLDVPEAVEPLVEASTRTGRSTGRPWCVMVSHCCASRRCAGGRWLPGVSRPGWGDAAGGQNHIGSAEIVSVRNCGGRLST